MSALVGGSFGASAAELSISWLTWRPGIAAVQVLLSWQGAVAYVTAAVMMAMLLRSRRDGNGRGTPELLAGSSVALCGLGYLVGLAALRYPVYGLGDVVQAATVSLATAALGGIMARRLAAAVGRSTRARLERLAAEHARELDSANARLAEEADGRRRAEQGLRRTGAMLNRYVENTPLGVIEFELADPAEPRWEVRRWSGQAEQIFGWTEAETLGRTAAELGLIVEDDLEQARAQARVLASGAEVRLRQVCRARRLGDGQIRHCAWYSSAIRPDGDGPPAALALVEDITPRVQALEEVRRLAQHDSLTGLPNRRLFRDRLEQALAAARKSDGGRAALLMIDLDHFKPVNDTLGHAAGDELLRAAARRLAGEVRAGDTIARLGGDEFAVVQATVREPGDAAALAGRLVAALRLPFAIDGQAVRVGATVGVAMFPDDAEDVEALLRRADRALYRAKADGRGRHRSFSRALDPDPARLVASGAAAGALPAA